MTRDELLQRLSALYNDGVYDNEMAHADADEALLDYIDDPDVRAAYERIEKWYA